MAALEERAAELSDLTRFDDEAATIDPQDAIVAIHTGTGEQLAARLVIGADGRQSLSREAAGIDVSRRDLHQSALTLQHQPFKAAQWYLDRISYAARAVRVRAPARQPLQRGVGLGAREASG